MQDLTLDRPSVFGEKSDLFWKPKKFGLLSCRDIPEICVREGIGAGVIGHNI